MALEDLVNVTITKQTATVSRVGFGTPLIMSSEATTVLSTTTSLYTSTTAMVTDGFPADGPTVAAATKIFSQNPKVSRIVVGKRTNLPTMSVDLTPTAANSTLYTVDVGGTEFDYTSDATATVAEITAGLTAIIDQTAWVTTTAYSLGDYVSANGNVYKAIVAGTSGATAPSGTATQTDGAVTWEYKGKTQNVNATDGTTKLTVAAADGPGGVGVAWVGSTAYSVDDYVTNAGSVYRCSFAGTSAASGGPTSTGTAEITDGTAKWFFTGIFSVPFAIKPADRTLLALQDVTADPGVVTDLTTIRTALDGNDDWYALILDTHGKAEIEAMAAQIETLLKIYLTSTSDADVLTAVATDIGSSLSGDGYERTAILWNEEPGEYPEAAWGGRCLPSDPGSITWKFKTLTGITASILTVSEDAELLGKNVNRYREDRGRSYTCEGVMSGGEFIDVTRGIDFITARLKENVFLRMVSLPKIPFTDPGIAVVENEVRGVMDLGIAQGIFAADPAPVVQVPLAADVDSNDKANRLLSDVTFSATLAGAIHAVEINGTVVV